MSTLRQVNIVKKGQIMSTQFLYDPPSTKYASLGSSDGNVIFQNFSLSHNTVKQNNDCIFQGQFHFSFSGLFRRNLSVSRSMFYVLICKIFSRYIMKARLQCSLELFVASSFFCCKSFFFKSFDDITLNIEQLTQMHFKYR